jgi:RNA polymerase sigma-70 factor (ECF subfamily)
MEALEAELRALMIAALAGDAAAYRTLLNSLYGRLGGYFRRRLGAERQADVDDLVQETLMAVHAKRATYDPARPFTVWLHAIARYKLIDHLRRKRMHTALPIEDAETLFEDDGGDVLTRIDVDRLLATLPEGARVLIRDVKLKGRSIAEAAAATGLSESAVKVRIHRGLRLLAEHVRGKARS